MKMRYALVVAVSVAIVSGDSSSNNSTSRGSNSPSLIGRAAKPSLPANLSLPSGAFIENKGQFDGRVKFKAGSGGNTLWVTNSGVTFDGGRPSAAKETSKAKQLWRTRVGEPSESAPLASDRVVIKEEFIGARPGMVIRGEEPLGGDYNYLIGNDPAQWHTRVKAYSEITYEGVWNGVDVRLSSKSSHLEQEFILHPNADPNQIRVSYEGIEDLAVAGDGSLKIHSALGDWTETAPYLYQEIEGKRIPIRGKFMAAGKTAYSFEVGAYRKEYAVVIDPTLLFSTYLGYSSVVGYGIAVDSSGSTYVTGSTAYSNFPTTSGVIQPTCPAPPNCIVGFVSKFNPAGGLQYSTYLGSTTGGDVSLGIAVDQNGDAYMTGVAQSGFPTTPSSAYQATCVGSIFVSKLDPAGQSLLYSTCIGSQFEYGVDGDFAPRGIAIDTNGRAYITGATLGGLPTTPNALQPSFGSGGSSEAFLSLVDPSLSGVQSLVYSTFLGPADGTNSGGLAVAVDAYENAYLTGSTTSKSFPVTPNVFQSTNLQDQCPVVDICPTAFVAKINPNVSGPGGLIYSSYLGGTTDLMGWSGVTAGDTGYAIAVDSLGDAYIAGQTYSPNFPTTPGSFQPVPFNGLGGLNSNAFITKVNPYGTAKVYSTFLELNCGTTGAYGIALDLFGNAYVVGETNDPAGNFPVTQGVFQPNNNGNGDAFLTELNSSGSGLIYSSFLGGSGGDSALGVAIDAVGDAYLTGETTSLDFPKSEFAYQPVLGGGVCTTGCANAFVTKFPLSAPGGLSITGIIPNTGGNAGTVTPQITGTGFHGGATAQLNCGTQTIPGTNVIVGAGGQLLNTTFDLTRASPGTCNLVVINVDSTSTTELNAFTVQQGGAPNIRVNVVGNLIRKPPQDQPMAVMDATYYSVVTNLGNIDSQPGYVTSIPDPNVSFTEASPPTMVSPVAFFPPPVSIWSVPPFPAGGSQTFTYSGTVAPSTPAGTNLTTETCFTEALSTFAQCLLALPCTDAAENCTAAYSSCQTISSWADAYNCGINLFNCIQNVQGCHISISPCLEDAAKSYGDCDDLPLLLLPGPSDPNYLVGPNGVASQRWVAGGGALSYVLGFSNDVKATEPAQQVIATLPLAANVNTSTLSLFAMTITSGTAAPSIHIPVPAGAFNPAIGLNEFATNVDLRPTQSLFVLVDAKLDPNTNTITWNFTSIDPTTGLPPASPDTGFLPPGASANVAFTVIPNPAQSTGATISEQGSVVFVNSGINQPPVNTKVWVNTIDSTPPASQVKALPGHSCLDFKVSWSGTDVGSGIQDYTIYVSDTAGPFAAWLTSTPATSATYQGQDGHSYGFYSIARDRSGNMEAAKTGAEATTAVGANVSCGGPPSLASTATVQSLSGTALTLALQISNNGTEAANNIVINKIAARVLSGTGKVSVTGPTLPYTVGNLPPGGSTTVNLILTVPKQVTNLGLIEAGSMQDPTAKTYTYTLGQEVVP